jgi:hypothetical protein
MAVLIFNLWRNTTRNKHLIEIHCFPSCAVDLREASGDLAPAMSWRHGTLDEGITVLGTVPVFGPDPWPTDNETGSIVSASSLLPRTEKFLLLRTKQCSRLACG